MTHDNTVTLHNLTFQNSFCFCRVFRFFSFLLFLCIACTSLVSVFFPWQSTYIAFLQKRRVSFSPVLAVTTVHIRCVVFSGSATKYSVEHHQRCRSPNCLRDFGGQKSSKNSPASRSSTELSAHQNGSQRSHRARAGSSRTRAHGDHSFKSNGELADAWTYLPGCQRGHLRNTAAVRYRGVRLGHPRRCKVRLALPVVFVRLG